VLNAEKIKSYGGRDCKRYHFLSENNGAKVAESDVVDNAVICEFQFRSLETQNNSEHKERRRSPYSKGTVNKCIHQTLEIRALRNGRCLLGRTLTELASVHVVAVLVVVVVAADPMLERCDINGRKQRSDNGIEI
jgi:hypothetical protein